MRLISDLWLEYFLPARKIWIATKAKSVAKKQKGIGLSRIHVKNILKASSETATEKCSDSTVIPAPSIFSKSDSLKIFLRDFYDLGVKPRSFSVGWYHLAAFSVKTHFLLVLYPPPPVKDSKRDFSVLVQISAVFENCYRSSPLSSYRPIIATNAFLC